MNEVVGYFGNGMVFLLCVGWFFVVWKKKWKKKLNVNLEIIKIIENFLKIIEIDIEGSY